jgi:hypothetical protein
MRTFLGKLHINSLNDLMKYSMSGSKEMAIDELNDFAEHGRAFRRRRRKHPAFTPRF